jgi:hypothetical protein
MSIRRKNVAVSVEEQDMPKKNVGIYIHLVFVVLKIMIIKIVGTNKFPKLIYKYNVDG